MEVRINGIPSYLNLNRFESEMRGIRYNFEIKLLIPTLLLIFLLLYLILLVNIIAMLSSVYFELYPSFQRYLY